MLTVVLDMTLRCPRDRFFLMDERLLADVALDALDWARERDTDGETLVLRHGFTVPQAVAARASELMDGAPTRGLDPARDVTALLSFIAARLPDAEGALLYLNPFQGALTRERIEAMPLSSQPGEVHVSAIKAASNIHPLWATPVPVGKRGKSAFVLRKKEADRTLRDDAAFMKALHNGSKQPILGSQFLQKVHMLDAALVSADCRGLRDSLPQDWSVTPVTGGETRCRDAAAMPWFYCVPVFNMSRETRIDWTPKAVPDCRNRGQARVIEE